MIKITEDIIYAGVNDFTTDLFEGQYKIPNGISYNSYVVLDEKISVFDTVDKKFTSEWLLNIKNILNGRTPDYLIIQHLEPDHSSSILDFMAEYPEVTVVSNAKAFNIMKQFFKTSYEENRIVIADGETLNTGKHTFKFIFAPMVHWPEVTVTYDSFDKVLFSADGFGKFGTPDSEEKWDDEARRYYIGIVGKYGTQVQALLKKAAALEIEKICPLHGPVLSENLSHYIGLYDKWSSYAPEEKGVVIAYTSVYGNTKKAVEMLCEALNENGVKNVFAYDLARTDMSMVVAQAFRFDKLILATTTYNADIFPFMRDFIEHLTERNFKNRFVGIIENGSWAPLAAKIIKEKLSVCKDVRFAENVVTIKSSLDNISEASLKALSEEIANV